MIGTCELLNGVWRSDTHTAEWDETDVGDATMVGFRF